MKFHDTSMSCLEMGISELRGGTVRGMCFLWLKRMRSRRRDSQQGDGIAELYRNTIRKATSQHHGSTVFTSRRTSRPFSFPGHQIMTLCWAKSPKLLTAHLILHSFYLSTFVLVFLSAISAFYPLIYRFHQDLVYSFILLLYSSSTPLWHVRVSPASLHIRFSSGLHLSVCLSPVFQCSAVVEVDWWLCPSAVSLWWMTPRDNPVLPNTSLSLSPTHSLYLCLMQTHS